MDGGTDDDGVVQMFAYRRAAAGSALGSRSVTLSASVAQRTSVMAPSCKAISASMRVSGATGLRSARTGAPTPLRAIAGTPASAASPLLRRPYWKGAAPGSAPGFPGYAPCGTRAAPRACPARLAKGTVAPFWPSAGRTGLVKPIPDDPSSEVRPILERFHLFPQ
jgi:hypothetical protein